MKLKWKNLVFYFLAICFIAVAIHISIFPRQICKRVLVGYNSFGEPSYAYAYGTTVYPSVRTKVVGVVLGIIGIILACIGLFVDFEKLKFRCFADFERKQRSIGA